VDRDSFLSYPIYPSATFILVASSADRLRPRSTFHQYDRRRRIAVHCAMLNGDNLRRQLCPIELGRPTMRAPSLAMTMVLKADGSDMAYVGEYEGNTSRDTDSRHAAGERVGRTYYAIVVALASLNRCTETSTSPNTVPDHRSSFILRNRSSIDKASLLLVGLLVLVNLEVSQGVGVLGGGNNSEEVLQIWKNQHIFSKGVSCK
jgi:hypothetical protein